MPTLKLATPAGQDAYTEIQNVVNSLGAGSILDIPCYSNIRCEQTLIVDRDVTIKGNESTLYQTGAGDRTRANLRIQGPGVTLDRLHVKGTKPLTAPYDALYEAQHGYHFATGARDAALLGCRATDVRGDLLYFADVAGVHVEDFVGTRCGRAFSSFIKATDIDIVRPMMDQGQRSGFNFEPHGPQSVSGNIRVREGNFGSIRLNMVAMHGAPLGVMNGFYFDDNVMRGSGLAVTIMGSDEAQTRNNLFFRRNVSNFMLGNPMMAAIRADHVHGLTVVQNEQPMGFNRYMRMVKTHGGSNALVKDNTGENMVGQLLVA